LKLAENPAATPTIKALLESIRRPVALYNQVENPPERIAEGPSGPADPPKTQVTIPDIVLTMVSRGIIPVGVRWKTSRIV